MLCMQANEAKQAGVKMLGYFYWALLDISSGLKATAIRLAWCMLITLLTTGQGRQKTLWLGLPRTLHKLTLLANIILHSTARTDCKHKQFTPTWEMMETRLASHNTLQRSSLPQAAETFAGLA